MLDFPHTCKADRKPQPHDWTYHSVALLLEDMAPMTRTEKDALRMLVSKYADEVARKDGRAINEGIAETLEAFGDFAHEYARHFRKTFAD